MTHTKRALMVSIAVLAAAAALGCGVVDSGTADGEVAGDGGGGGGSGGDGGAKTDGGSTGADGETGRMVGMTGAHNGFRPRGRNRPRDPRPRNGTSAIAAVAQAYSEHLAAHGCDLVHSQGDYGENSTGRAGWRSRPPTWSGAGRRGRLLYVRDVLGGDSCDQSCTPRRCTAAAAATTPRSSGATRAGSAAGWRPAQTAPRSGPATTTRPATGSVKTRTDAAPSASPLR